MLNAQRDDHLKSEKRTMSRKKNTVSKSVPVDNEKIHREDKPVAFESDKNEEGNAEMESHPNTEATDNIKESAGVEDPSFKKINSSFDQAIQNFKRIIPSKNKKIVFSGHILEFDKGICNFLNQISNACLSVGAELLCLSHAINVKNVIADQKITFDYFTVPYTVGLNRYEKDIDVILPEYIESKIEEKAYLKAWSELMELRHKDMGKNYPKLLAYELYNYFIEFLNHFRPEMVILWCEFYAGHSILKEICKEYGIKTLYMEFGSLPGTIAIEENGQMGESLVSINAGEFLRKYVSEEELLQAENVLTFLKDSKLNRRPQPKSDAIEKISRRFNPERPIVVMFGQNDYEAGIKPYTNTAKEFHSPVFESSDAAAQYVGKLAKKNKWNFIYKPHQMMVRVDECLEENFPASTLWVGDSDINELIDIADVCITIVSQCGYVSLIREKPVVMLGYTQLKEKGCTYEAFEKKIVEESIKAAIKNGYTSEQKDLFKKHVAQLLKYYLFDDLQQDIGFGQPIEAADQYIINQLLSIEEKKEDEYPTRRVLMVCRTSVQIESAILISKNFNDSVKSDILLVGIQNYEIDLTKLNIYFERTFQISGKEEDRSEDASFFNRSAYYDDLFVPDYDRVIIYLFNHLASQNITLKVHFYDGADMEFYIKNIAKDIANSKKNAKTNAFYSNFSEICLYDRRLKIWKDSLNFPMTVMPVIGNGTTDDKEYKSPAVKTNYVYIESPLFARRYTTNENELIEYVNEYVAKNKLIIYINEENDIDLYSLQGYSTSRNIESLISEKKSKTYIFSTYIEKFFVYSMQHDNIVYFDLSEILIGNFELLQSNSYKKLKAILDEMNQKNYYRPNNLEELEELMIYERGQ